METIELRGHHIKNIEIHLLKEEKNSLRNTGRFDYNLNFSFIEKYYSSRFTKNIWRVYNYLVDENPPVHLINGPDVICKPSCPFYKKKGSIKCIGIPGVYKEESLQEHSDELVKMDIDYIKRLGFDPEDTVKFSKIFRTLVNKNYKDFGFKDFDTFIENIDDILHPKLVEFYLQ